MASVFWRARRVKSVSPPSCQQGASGAGKFSHCIQSGALRRTCPLTHFAYIIWSFNAGSSGLMPEVEILGMKYLHHGTVLYLPYVRFCMMALAHSAFNCRGRDAIIPHFARFHQWACELPGVSRGRSARPNQETLLGMGRCVDLCKPMIKQKSFLKHSGERGMVSRAETGGKTVA